MRRRLVAAIGLLAAATALRSAHANPIPARPRSGANEPRNATSVYTRGLLWRVERPGVRPTHLFGTLHLDDERVTALAPPVASAFDGARVLVIELLNDEASVTRFRRAMMSGEPPLRDRLGEAYAEVAKALDAHDVPRAKQARLATWAALLVLLQPVERQGIILDHVLVMRAQAQGKGVAAMETVDEQIEAFAGLREEAQVALLEDAARHQDRIHAAVRPLLEAYLVRDLAAMDRINREAMGDDPALREDHAELLERVLYARNRRFVERIAPYIDRGGAFVAFGALHLYGTEGVPATLASRGYTVRRVW